jgi:threonine dehydrogenase-like Zn-dependent dehydrogenase
MMLRVALAFVDGKRFEIVEVILTVRNGTRFWWKSGPQIFAKRMNLRLPEHILRACFRLVDWYINGKIEIRPTIIHTVPLKDINKAFDRMHEGKSSTAS